MGFRGERRQWKSGTHRRALRDNSIEFPGLQHDCQKPVDLLEDLIRNSTAVNEIVLDPFAGSGSTLLAAKKANRTYLGYEKEKSYQNSFLNELEKINGRK